MEYGKLTISDAGRLTEIMNAATHSSQVGRVIDETVFRGQARCICQINGNSADDSDVRDLYLRVTDSAGMDYFWLVKDLMPEVESGYFVVSPE